MKKKIFILFIFIFLMTKFTSVSSMNFLHLKYTISSTLVIYSLRYEWFRESEFIEISCLLPDFQQILMNSDSRNHSYLQLLVTYVDEIVYLRWRKLKEHTDVNFDIRKMKMKMKIFFFVFSIQFFISLNNIKLIKDPHLIICRSVKKSRKSVKHFSNYEENRQLFWNRL